MSELIPVFGDVGSVSVTREQLFDLIGSGRDQDFQAAMDVTIAAHPELQFWISKDNPLKTIIEWEPRVPKK